MVVVWRGWLASLVIWTFLISCNTDSLNASDSSRSLLHGEDFSTGLLNEDLSVPQHGLMEEWALARGFLRDKDKNVVTGDFMCWEYCREDGLRFTYSFGIGRAGPEHDLALQCEELQARPMAPVEGVPAELLPGTPLRDFLAKWGATGQWNRRQMRSYRAGRSEILSLEYSGESLGVTQYLGVFVSDDVVASASLTLIAGARAASR